MRGRGGQEGMGTLRHEDAGDIGVHRGTSTQQHTKLQGDVGTRGGQRDIWGP